MARTAIDIITQAFRKAGILARGETLSSEEANDALNALNDLLDSVSNDSLMITSRVTESFPLTSGQSTYTIGAGGDFNTARPISILKAFIRISGIDYGCGIISDEQYADIILKSVESIPYFLNYTNAFPLGQIKLYPVPLAGYQLHLLSTKEITELGLYTELQLAPGWNRYLVNQLAIEIAPDYGVRVPDETVLSARQAEGFIKRASARVKTMNAYPLGREGSIYTGWET